MAKQRKDFMTESQCVQMRTVKHRTHQDCLEKTGVARPGKTSKDRFMRHRGQG